MSIEVFETYYERHNELLSMLKSTINWAAIGSILDADNQGPCLLTILKKFPFLSMVYVLNNDGVQVGDTVIRKRFKFVNANHNGSDRSHRPYYMETMTSMTENLTEPYFSTHDGKICITISVPIFNKDKKIIGLVVADCDINRAIALLDNDERRRMFEPYFKFLYTVISFGLLGVSVGLIYKAFKYLFDLIHDFGHGIAATHGLDGPFQATILFTLSLAIFDLAKTVFEEEVLISKDIKRNSTMRRTLTRFFSTILIAVSIEGLLLVFRFSLSEPSKLMYAVALLVAASMMLFSIGLFVYFGSKAENMLLKNNLQKRRSKM
jgi:uncharacterized membrane protein YGL010W